MIDLAIERLESNAKSTLTWTPILIQVGHFNKLIRKLKCRFTWTKIKNYSIFLPRFFRIDSPAKLKIWDLWTIRSSNASPTVWSPKWLSYRLVSYWLVISNEPLSLCLSITLIKWANQELLICDKPKSSKMSNLQESNLFFKVEIVPKFTAVLKFSNNSVVL